MERKLAASSKRYLLIIGDILIFYFSLWLTLILRYQSNYTTGTWNQHFWPFTIVLAVFLIIFYIDELYDIGFSNLQRQLINRLFRSGLIGAVLATSFFYFGYNRFFTIQPQRVLLIHLVIALILIYLWHSLVHRFSRSERLANNVLLIGTNKLSSEVIKQVNDSPQLGYQIKAQVNTKSDNGNAPAFITTFNNLNELRQICLDQKIDTIVSTINPRDNPDLLKNLFACLSLKINFFDITNFYEKITGKIPVTTIEHIWFLENLNQGTKRMYEINKRLFDISISVLLLVISIPFIPLIAAAIKIGSPGSIFFTQQRVGKDKRNFTLIKFRTMISGAESNGAQWASKNDPRVTKLGKFLRASRIDEIPQLLNVLKNEMSLIGPRPERPEFVSQLQEVIPFYTERLLTKPGLTGWAQVAGPAYGGSKEESLEKLQYDLFYIKNRSLGLDMSILLKTIRTVLSRKGQ